MPIHVLISNSDSYVIFRTKLFVFKLKDNSAAANRG